MFASGNLRNALPLSRGVASRGAAAAAAALAASWGLSTAAEGPHDSTCAQVAAAGAGNAVSSGANVLQATTPAEASTLAAAAAPTAAATLTPGAVPLPTEKLSCKIAAKPPRTPVVLVSCGSFNPPTVMHLRMVDLAAHELMRRGYDVWGAYMSPVADAYGKAGLAPAADRVAMCRLAAADASCGCRRSSHKPGPEPGPGSGSGSRPFRLDPELDLTMVYDWEAHQPGYTRTLAVLRRVEGELRGWIQPRAETGAGYGAREGDQGPVGEDGAAIGAGREDETAEDRDVTVRRRSASGGAGPDPGPGAFGLAVRDAHDAAGLHERKQRQKQEEEQKQQQQEQATGGTQRARKQPPLYRLQQLLLPLPPASSPAHPPPSQRQAEPEAPAPPPSSSAPPPLSGTQAATPAERLPPPLQQQQQQQPEPQLQQPQVRAVLLCGGDVLASMAVPGVWRDPDVILREHGVVCVARNGTDLDALLNQPGTVLYDYRDRIVLVYDRVGNSVSSSKVREELAAGRPVRHLVPAGVLSYIYDKGLYGAGHRKATGDAA